MNKADLADESASREWLKWYGSKGVAVIFIDSIKGNGINQLKAKAQGNDERPCRKR